MWLALIREVKGEENVFDIIFYDYDNNSMGLAYDEHMGFMLDCCKE